ncbi:expressed protein [Echinococcus multilocularis]|uniref:Expressed protein n=1 Tax=Echinococcus multilocularis TaxID=6211 RepID=A0A068YHA7_ECHMU|nr:expressed protein [Echinococcus multilocularis]
MISLGDNLWRASCETYVSPMKTMMTMKAPTSSFRKFVRVFFEIKPLDNPSRLVR